MKRDDAIGAIFKFVMVAAGCVLCGCGRNNLPGDSGTLTGRITYQRKPAPAGAVVAFTHTRHGIVGAGELDSDGSFVLKMRGSERILVGDYTVAVMPPFDAELTPEQKRAMAAGLPVPEGKQYKEIPRRYSFPDQNGIKFNVTTGKNFFELDMTPPLTK